MSASTAVVMFVFANVVVCAGLLIRHMMITPFAKAKLRSFTSNKYEKRLATRLTQLFSFF